MDFALGALMCPGGKSVTVLPSRRNGVSTITINVSRGAAVSLSREHAQYVVTEYGIAELFGRTLEERIKRMISIAHPDDRQQLESDYREMVKAGKAAKAE